MLLRRFVNAALMMSAAAFVAFAVYSDFRLGFQIMQALRTGGR